MKGFRKIFTIVAAAAVCAGASEISRCLPDDDKPTLSPEGILLGDVFEDGTVNASDASLILSEYSLLSTGKPPTITEKQAEAADVNGDGKYDSIDATIVLAYYSRISTGEYISMEDYVENEF